MGAGGPGAFAAREFRKKLSVLRNFFGVNTEALFIPGITSEFKDEDTYLLGSYFLKPHRRPRRLLFTCRFILFGNYRTFQGSGSGPRITKRLY